MKILLAVMSVAWFLGGAPLHAAEAVAGPAVAMPPSALQGRQTWSIEGLLRRSTPN